VRACKKRVSSHRLVHSHRQYLHPSRRCWLWDSRSLVRPFHLGLVACSARSPWFQRTISADGCRQYRSSTVASRSRRHQVAIPTARAESSPRSAHAAMVGLPNGHRLCGCGCWRLVRVSADPLTFSVSGTCRAPARRAPRRATATATGNAQRGRTGNPPANARRTSRRARRGGARSHGMVGRQQRRSGAQP